MQMHLSREIQGCLFVKAGVKMKGQRELKWPVQRGGFKVKAKSSALYGDRSKIMSTENSPWERITESSISLPYCCSDWLAPGWNVSSSCEDRSPTATENTAPRLQAVEYASENLRSRSTEELLAHCFCFVLFIQTSSRVSLSILSERLLLSFLFFFNAGKVLWGERCD